MQNIVDRFVTNIISKNRYKLILDGLKTTILVSLWASLFRQYCWHYNLYVKKIEV